MFDGDGADPQAQEKLNFDNTFAFKNFSIEKIPIPTSILALMPHEHDDLISH